MNTDVLPIFDRSVKRWSGNTPSKIRLDNHPGQGARSTAGMTDFGGLVRKLRTERGFTQTSLAGAAGISEPSVRRAERNKKCIWKRSTALDVFRALDRKVPIDAASRVEYLTGAGLDPGTPGNAGPEQAQARAFHVFLQTLNDDKERQAAMWFLQLMDAVGAASLMDTLRGVAAMAKVELIEPGSEEELREVRVVHPPVQRAGHTEQVIETLRVKPGELSKTQKAERGGGRQQKRRAE